MHRLLALLFTVALGLTLAACAAPSGRVLTEAGGDGTDILGTWQIIALWDSGREAPADVVADFQMIFTPDAVRYELGGTVMSATYSLNPAAEPKQIDLYPEGRGTWHGIYALSGDTLKIVTPDTADPAASERSTAFESVAGSDNDWYAILTRR